MKKSSIDRLREYQIKSGYIPVDVNEYEVFIERSISKDLPKGVRDNLKKTMLDELRMQVGQLPTEYQNPSTFMILQMLFKKIQKAAVYMSEQNKFNFPDRLTYGTASIGSFTAFVEDREHEQDYLILVSDDLFTFAHLLSKSIGMLTIDFSGKSGDKTWFHFNLNEDHIEHALITNHEAIIRFTDLILAYSITNRASNAEQYTPDHRLAAISSLFLDSFELFVVGHEYSHLLLGHFFDRAGVAEDTEHYVELNAEKIEIIVTNWKQEIEADVLAAYLAITAMEGYDFASSYAGVDIGLITLIILERLESELKGKTLDPVTHPPAEMRREAVYENMLKVDNSIKGIYEANSHIIDALWNRCMYLITKLDEMLRETVNHKIINVPYSLTQRLLYRIGDKLLLEFVEMNK